MSHKMRVLAVMILLAAVVIALAVTRPRTPAEGLRAAFDAEFITRPDGYPGLKEAYGLQFPSTPLQMDPGLMYRALAQGEVDVIDAFATDGRIEAYDLFILEDDRGFFPPYYAAPLVRADTLARYPQLEEVLNRLAGRISDDEMRRLNFQVDEEGRRAREVAHDFLLEEGLLLPGSEPGSGEAGRISVGGKHFTEQEILGELVCLLIEHETNLRVNRRLNLGGTLVCFNALRAGDLDLYVEYTGTGLVNILDQDPVSDPDEAYRMVEEEFRSRWDLVWLKPLGFNNSYTLTMRREQAQQLGLRTISDLAEMLRLHAQEQRPAT